MSISGIGHKANLKEWVDYAKNNSYMRDKAAVKTSLGTEGCDRDIVEGCPIRRARSAKRVGTKNTYEGLGQPNAGIQALASRIATGLKKTARCARIGLDGLHRA